MVPAGVRMKVTEIISTTVTGGQANYTLTTGTLGGASNQAVGLLNSVSATSGYYVEQY